MWRRNDFLTVDGFADSEEMQRTLSSHTETKEKHSKFHCCPPETGEGGNSRRRRCRRSSSVERFSVNKIPSSVKQKRKRSKCVRECRLWRSSFVLVTITLAGLRSSYIHSGMRVDSFVRLLSSSSSLCRSHFTLSCSPTFSSTVRQTQKHSYLSLSLTAAMLFSRPSNTRSAFLRLGISCCVSRCFRLTNSKLTVRPHGDAYVV